MQSPRNHAVSRTAATAVVATAGILAGTQAPAALTSSIAQAPEWVLYLLPALAVLIEAIAQYIKARAARANANHNAAP